MIKESQLEPKRFKATVKKQTTLLKPLDNGTRSDCQIVEMRTTRDKRQAVIDEG
jgi:hypothetical protein